ncbi:fused MFS/spermidine synthase [Planctomycetota bacterium]
MRSRRDGWFLIFPVTVFLSAFLLFQVQPLIGKFILPWFGGSPSVWTVCMLFFQVFLFGGYCYAHLISRLRSVRWQGIGHGILLLLALALLPITPSDHWQPDGQENPTGQIILLLTVCVGLAYILLSATGPLLQAWFHRAYPHRSPYALYALSNLGSLLALVTYPLLFEPRWGAEQQTIIWSWSFGLFAVCCIGCSGQAIRQHRNESVEPSTRMETPAPPGRGRYVLWFLLALVPSVMLLATTNQICTDVAVIPFLWVLPLTLYLLSFILCFHSLRWCARGPWTLVWAVMVAIIVPVMYAGLAADTAVPLLVQIGVYGSLLFACAMWCHGELARNKPHPTYLTAFYLTLSAGGAAGGLFVGLLAPAIFQSYLELPLIVLACSVLMLVIYYRDASGKLSRGRPRWAWAIMVVMLLALLAGLSDIFQRSLIAVIEIRRNFYGVTKIQMSLMDPTDPNMSFQLIHGRTLHGEQYIAGERRQWPTSYYGAESGIGQLLLHGLPGQSKRVGIVGLGVGTLAVYGMPGDYFRFYEINPDMIEVATEFFDFLPQCKAAWDIVPGDARIRLENEPPQAFNILVLDAFSSDAIPLHLLTQEAFALYLRHLQSEGVLAVHISNLHFDLWRVMAGHARTYSLTMLSHLSRDDEDRNICSSFWILMSRAPQTLDVKQFNDSLIYPTKQPVYWSDDRNSLFEILIKKKSSDNPLLLK